MVKVVTGLVVPGLLAVKTVAPEPSSFFTTTSIVTPWGGIVEVMETVSGKSVCGAAGWFEFAGGFNVTARLASVPPPPPPLSEQLHVQNIIAGTINN